MLRTPVSGWRDLLKGGANLNENEKPDGFAGQFWTVPVV